MIYLNELNTNKTVSKPPSCHVSKIYNSVYFDPTSESSSANTNGRFKVHQEKRHKSARPVERFVYLEFYLCSGMLLKLNWSLLTFLVCLYIYRGRATFIALSFGWKIEILGSIF